MSNYALMRTYLEAMFGPVLVRARRDDRGFGTAELIVLVGMAVIGAGAVGVIVWNKLKSGATNIQTPSGGAP